MSDLLPIGPKTQETIRKLLARKELRQENREIGVKKINPLTATTYAEIGPLRTAIPAPKRPQVERYKSFEGNDLQPRIGIVSRPTMAGKQIGAPVPANV